MSTTQPTAQATRITVALAITSSFVFIEVVVTEFGSNQLLKWGWWLTLLAPPSGSNLASLQGLVNSLRIYFESFV